MANPPRDTEDAHALRVVEDVTCTRCGCVCDDLKMHVRGASLSRAEGACPRAVEFLLHPGLYQIPDARAWHAGQPTTLDQALAEAAALLRRARAPLICGALSSSTAGQQAAVRLADHLGAIFDSAGDLHFAAPVMALQDVGQVTCSLGEVRHRADLVVFWRSDPAANHPRLSERFLEPSGLLCPAGRSQRQVWVIDDQPTPTSALADELVLLPHGRDVDFWCALRAILRDCPLAGNDLQELPLPRLRDLAVRLRDCRYGVLFYGTPPASEDVPHAAVAALLRLAAELNQSTRCCAVALPEGVVANGVDNVLTWQTGYPCSVNLAHGYPRYGPDEYTASRLLERREVDAILLVGSGFTQRFSQAAAEAAAHIPTIVLDDGSVTPRIPATVNLLVAAAGVHHAGTTYRLDDVCLPLRPFLPRHLPTDAELLDALFERLK